jgi:hypothetical protein
VGRAVPDDHQGLERALGTHHPVPLTARRAPPGRLHDQQHRNLNRQIRKAIKTRGSFPDEQAATKLIYLAISKAQRSWQNAYHWPAAIRALKIHFADRIPD